MSTHRPEAFRGPHRRRPSGEGDPQKVSWTRIVIVLLVLVLLANVGLLVKVILPYTEPLNRYLWHPMEALAKWGDKFLGLFLLWAFFFAQFLLPLERVGDRWKMTLRVVSHGAGWAGSLLMVQDGRILSSQDKVWYTRPGLVVTDLASAVVLRTKRNYSRVVPPSSVAFLSSTEYVEDVVDLRDIARVVGPHEEDRPFAPRKPGEDEGRYEERRARFYQTRGLTRDGVEVVARIWVKFHLRDDDEEQHDAFPCAEERWRLWFDRERRAFPPFRTLYHGTARSVWRAVLSRPLRTETPGAGEGDGAGDAGYWRYPWDWLPAMMAAELWREYVCRFTLDELFTPLAHHDGHTGVEMVQRAMEARLTQNKYREMDASGRFNQAQAGVRDSQEFHALEQRGIAVDKVVIIGLFFPPEVEKGLAQLRANTWLQRAQVEREAVERQRALTREQGERAALGFFGRSLRRLQAALQLAMVRLQEENDRVAWDAFFLEVASTVMADLADAFDRSDFRERLGAREVGRLRKLLARLRSFMHLS